MVFLLWLSYIIKVGYVLNVICVFGCCKWVLDEVGIIGVINGVI